MKTDGKFSSVFFLFLPNHSKEEKVYMKNKRKSEMTRKIFYWKSWKLLPETAIGKQNSTSDGWKFEKKNWKLTNYYYFNNVKDDSGHSKQQGLNFF